MITAAEAREIAVTSEAALLQRMEDIGGYIKNAALLGKHRLLLAECNHYDTVYTVASYPYRSAEFTSIQRLIKDKLVAAGYMVKIETRSQRGGQGLGAMDDDAPDIKIDEIVITW